MGRILLAAALGLAGPLAAQTSFTIYSDGRVLVRRTAAVAIPSGTSSHRLAIGLLEPGSLFGLDSGVAVVGASYDAAVDEGNTMRRAVGRELRFLVPRGSTADTVSAAVIGVNPERFRLSDGRIVFQRPGIPLYPAELVLLEPTLSLTVRSGAAKPSLRLGYFTQGASWQASYSAVLGRTVAQVSSQASIPSVTLREAQAEVQLLAGSVGRAGGMPGPPSPMAFRAQAAEMAQGPAEEQGVGEAHLYTIPGRVTLEPGVTASVALFDPASAPWERAYVVRGQLNYYGPLQQVGTEPNQVPVEVWYTLKRTPLTPFGELPLPGGTWRLYQADAGGRLQLIGESSAGHTAPGTDIRLSAGSAFDLTATRVQLTYSTRRDSLRTVATADYRVTITSAKDSAVTVEVLEERGGEWSVLQSSVPAEMQISEMRYGDRSHHTTLTR
ncbi:MAG TPA: hypothetical protein VJK71_00125 [Gemmatimonadales bacterium]|nr:hypothetical protein [Gemmatimonadales bacterium]